MASSPRLHVSSHPVLKHKLTLLRDKRTPASEFRAIMKELTFYLGYEATGGLTIQDKTVQTPLGECVGRRLSQRIALLPILRAGMGMVDPMLELLPMATVHHVGMYRQKGSKLPVLYYNKLPVNPDCDVCIILEPLAATGTTLGACVNLVKDWGLSGDQILVMSLLASQTGLDQLMSEHPDIHLFVGHVDAELSDDGYVMPGVGDVGDRLYCPGNKQHQAPNNKRQRIGEAKSTE